MSPPLLGDDQPRPHHYEFAHVVLRAIAFRVGADMLRLAADGRLASTLLSTWGQVGEGLPPDHRIPPDGLSVAMHEVSGLQAAIVTLPEPRHIGEAYLAAVVVGDGTDYFLLEHSWTTEDEPRTVIASWTRDGRHLNFGDGPSAEDPDAFLEAVARVLSIGT